MSADKVRVSVQVDVHDVVLDLINNLSIKEIFELIKDIDEMVAEIELSEDLERYFVEVMNEERKAFNKTLTVLGDNFEDGE